MLQIVALAIIIFLIWTEVIPVRVWVFRVKARLIGMSTRVLIDVLDFLDELLNSE